MRQFAAATGQLWKYRVFQALLYLAMILTVALFSTFVGNPAKLSENLVIGLYFPVALAFVAWSFLAIRCPRCQKNPMLYHASHGRSASAGQRMLEGNSCPACGFDPNGNGAGV